MKRLLALFLLLSVAKLQAEQPNAKTVKFHIHEKEYRYSNYFEFNANETPMGVVVKKRFAYLHLTNHYEVYNQLGEWEATGRCRLFSLGTLFSWATKIDIKDAKGKKIGLIDGELTTFAAARFRLYEYDAQGRKVQKGIAYMDHERRSFSILDPNNDKHVIAALRRIFLPHLRDHWEGQIFFPDALNMSVAKVFAAFAVDHQEYFRPDN